MSEIIKVGMADLNICQPPDGLTTLGLGSCVGVALRDPVARIGGLVHVMLPDSKSIHNSQSMNPAKFADTGIAELVRRMEQKGAKRSRMTAKLAGGATMFAVSGKSEVGLVGQRNTQACRQCLAELGISILAEDTGANYGRTVIFYPESGEYQIRAVGRDSYII